MGMHPDAERAPSLRQHFSGLLPAFSSSSALHPPTHPPTHHTAFPPCCWMAPGEACACQPSPECSAQAGRGTPLPRRRWVRWAIVLGSFAAMFLSRFFFGG